VIFILLFLLVFAISIAAIFWEVKLSTIFGSSYTSDSYQSTPNGYRKAQTGAAGAAAVSNHYLRFLLTKFISVSGFWTFSCSFSTY
jgi:hypothetical protein